MAHGGASALCALLGLLATLHFAAAAKDHVVAITGQKEFDAAIKSSDFVLVEFYAPWCGHCKRLEPEYSKAADALQGHDPAIVLAKVDATNEKNKELASKFGVKGFPTLKIFRDKDIATPHEYGGPREADGIVSYLKRQAGPPARRLASADELAAFIKGEDVAVVGVFTDKHADALAAFESAAKALRDDFPFASVSDPSLVEQCAGDACPGPAVFVFKSFDEPEVKYEGEMESEQVVEWVENKGTPLVVVMDKKDSNRKALQKVFKSHLPKLVGLAKAGDQDEALLAKLGSAARAFSDVQFIFGEAGENAQALTYFGVAEADLPAFVIMVGQDKYVKKGADPELLPEWIEEYKTGALSKHLKSEEPPASNDGPVKVVVAKTFDELVFGGKDVLIEFYAPWCGHCKSLAPVYEEVGREYEGDGDVVVAKMDATANDVPSDKFSVRGFPTLNFVEGTTGKVLTYSGDRSKADLIKFINSHRTVGDNANKDEL